MSKRRFTLLSLAALCLHAACAPPPSGGGNENDSPDNDNAPPNGPVTHAVSMRGIAFVPEQVTIHVGDTVRWVNEEPFAIAHTVTSGVDSVKDDDPVLDSGTIPQGDTFEFTFTAAGEYVYFCEPHPVQMTNARVIVEP